MGLPSKDQYYEALFNKRFLSQEDAKCLADSTYYEISELGLRVVVNYEGDDYSTTLKLLKAKRNAGDRDVFYDALENSCPYSTN